MINIMFGGNYKVFDGIMINLLSLVKHCKDEVTVYVLTMDLRNINEAYVPITNKDIDYLKEILISANSNSDIKLIDMTDIFNEEMKNTVNINNFYTPYTLLRLYADKVIGMPDKIIYLDTDTLFNGNVKELFDIDVSDYELACVNDYLGRWFIGANYFNAGVLLLNMKMIKKTNLFVKARNMCLTKKMAFFDQDALNKSATLVKKIPTRFNSQRKRYKDTVIQHFCKSIRWLPFFHTINVKPWMVNDVRKRLKIHEYDDILDDYLLRIKRRG